MIKRDTKYAVVKKLVYLNCINYIVFLIMDFLKNKNFYLYSTNIKFFSIIICFIIGLSTGKDGYDKEDNLLLISALFFTVLADLNLLILDNFILGIFLFIIVQMIYIMRHSRKNTGFNYKYVYVFSLYILLFLIIKNLNIFKNESILISAAIVYGLVLINSLIIAYSTFNNKFFSKRTCKIISLAITLFFLCDINVGLFNISSYFHFTPKIVKFEYIISNLIWIFYLPSQILLCLSGYKNIEEIFKKM